MKDLFKNKKIKRILSSFLVVVILLSSFTSWGMSDVKADSNDNRRTVIQLAQGAQLTEMEDLKNLSYDDLKLFALYLSNYYIPFVTEFQEGATNEGLIENMTNALANHVGLSEDLASYFSQVTMGSVTQTAHQLYVPYDAVRAVHCAIGVSDTDSSSSPTHVENIWDKDPTYWKSGRVIGGSVHFSLGAAGKGSANKSAGGEDKNSSLSILDLDKYVDLVGGIKTVNDIQYVPLTYSVLLQLVDYSKRMSCWDSTIRGYYNADKNSEDFDTAGIQSISFDSYSDTTTMPDEQFYSDGYFYKQLFYTSVNDSYPYRYIRNYNSTKKYSTIWGGDAKVKLYNIAETCYAPIVWIDDSSGAEEAKVVFSNNEACMLTLASIYETVNLEHGYGSALLAVDSIEEMNSYSDNLVNLSAFCATLYTDWVGNICLWNGLTYKIIVPAACNPYTMSEITDYWYSTEGIEPTNFDDLKSICSNSNIYGSKVNFLNFINIKQAASADAIFKTDAYGDTSTPEGGYMKVYLYDKAVDHSKSIFNLHLYRAYEGTSDTNLDASNKHNWGKYQPVYDAFNSMNDIFYVNGTINPDEVTFPSWFHWDTSTMWNNGKASYRQNISMIAYKGDFLGVFSPLGRDWIGLNKVDLDDVDKDDLKESTWSQRHCTQFTTTQAHGIGQGLFVDNLGGVGNSTDLSSFFKHANLPTSNQIAQSICSELNFSAVQKDNEANSFTGNINKLTAQSLFLTYAFAYYNGAYYESGGFDKEAHIVNLKFNAELFPTGAGELDFSKVTPIEDTTEDEVLSMVYYLLHPKEGVNYFSTWLKNKAGGGLIGWHEDIVGSSDSNSSLGMTQYLGTSGYTTTPNLSDISWVESLLDIYDNIIVYILIILAVIMLCYIVLGQLSVQRAVIGFVMFGVCAFLPPYIMNFTIDTSNNISDRLFTEKFDYWALVQTEEYLGQIQGYYNASSEGDSTEILANLIAMNSSGGGIASETSYSSMRVKWISPKKYTDLAELTEALNSETSTNLLVKNASDTTKALVISSATSTTSGEDFSGADDLYLYRDILDIYRAGAITYNVMAQQSNSTISQGTIDENVLDYLDVSKMSTEAASCLASSSYLEGLKKLGKTDNLPDYYSLIKYESNNIDDPGDVDNFISSFSATQNGFIPYTTAATNISQNYYTSQNLASTYLVSYHNKYLEIYKYYYDNISNDGVIDISWNDAIDWSPFTEKLFANPNLSSFNYGISHVVSAITGKAADGEATTGVTTNKDNLDALYYAMYSESPYYFLNYQIRDVLRANNLYSYDMLNPTGIKQGGNTNSLVTLFLKDNQAYFYNYEDNDGYGELRDYLNMHDFFYLVIPSLKANADIIRWFDAQYTFNTYDTCSLRRQMDNSFKYDGITIINSDGTWNESEAGKFKVWYKALNEQERYEFWHDLNVNLLCYYSCTWLDAMLDCDYNKSETIKIGADKYVVEEPLNPYSYFETDDSGNIIKGRPMIFSRSEMQYYGLQEHNLTTVEKKIIELNDNVYKKSLDLTNYYTLSDETIIHAYSMICLFEFNNVFSDINPFGEDYILYPLGYELKAVTYDGYLRLMLYASSGEDLMYNDANGNKSIYTRIQEKTSIFFGIGLVINDLFAVYALPALKLFFLILLFLTSILIIIAGAIKLDLNLVNVIWKSLFAPMITFMAITIGLSIVSSLFMSNGASGVYESAPVIALGDPTALVLVQLIINIVVLILYGKLLKKAFKDFKTYVTSVLNDIAGTVTGAVGKIAGIAAGAHVISKLSKNAKERGTSNVSAAKQAAAGKNSADKTSAGKTSASQAEADAQAAREKAAADKKAYNDKAAADKKAKQDAKQNAKVDKVEGKAADKAYKQGDKASKMSSKADAVQDKIRQNNAKKNVIKYNRKLSDEQKAKQIAKLNKRNKALTNKRDKLRSRSKSFDDKGNALINKGITRSEKLKQKYQNKNAKIDARNTKRNAKIDRNITKQARKSKQRQTKLATKEAKLDHKAIQRQAKIATKEAKLARRELSTPIKAIKTTGKVIKTTGKVVKTTGRACKNLVKRGR